MCTLFRFTLLFQNTAFAPSYSGYCSPSISFNPKQRIDLKFQGWLCYGTARTRPNIEGHQGETSLLRAKSIKRITACFLTGEGARVRKRTEPGLHGTVLLYSLELPQ